MLHSLNPMGTPNHQRRAGHASLSSGDHTPRYRLLLLTDEPTRLEPIFVPVVGALDAALWTCPLDTNVSGAIVSSFDGILYHLPYSAMITPFLARYTGLLDGVIFVVDPSRREHKIPGRSNLRLLPWDWPEMDYVVTSESAESIMQRLRRACWLTATDAGGRPCPLRPDIRWELALDRVQRGPV